MEYPQNGTQVLPHFTLSSCHDFRRESGGWWTPLIPPAEVLTTCTWISGAT
jgi:hypothetical protein